MSRLKSLVTHPGLTSGVGSGLALGLILGLVLAGSAVATAAQAETDDGALDSGSFTADALEQVAVVQDRIYDRDHELGLVFGYIPDDDFHQSFPVGGNYIYHFNERYAWEVVRGQWSFNVDRGIKDQLANDYGVAPEEFDELQYLVHSSFMLKPTYGKDAIWNQGVINHEGYLSAGIGLAGYERNYSFGPSTTEAALSLVFGMGRKYFLSQRFSINLELRDCVVFKDEGTENNVYLGLGFAYRFDMSPRKADVDRPDHSIYRYLEDRHAR